MDRKKNFSNHCVLFVIVLKLAINCANDVGNVESVRNSPISFEEILAQFDVQYLKNFDILHLSMGSQDGCVCSSNFNPIPSGQRNPLQYCKNRVGCYHLSAGDDNDESLNLFNHTFGQNLLVLVSPGNNTSECLFTVLENILFKRAQNFVVLHWPTSTVTSRTPEDILAEISSMLNLSSLKLGFQSNFYVFFQTYSKNKTMTRIMFYEYYKIKKTLIFRELKIQTLYKTLQSQLPRRENLQRENIIPVASESGEYPYEVTLGPVANSNGQKRRQLLSGKAVKVFEDLKMMTNFSSPYALGGDEIQVHPKKATIHGSSAEYFKSGEADILISHNANRPAAAGLVKFLQPTRLTSVFAYFKRPPLKMRTTIFLDTFAPALWISLLALCFGILGALNAVFWLRDHNFRYSGDPSTLTSQSQPQPQDQGQAQCRFPDTVSWIIGVICQQGRRAFPSSIPVQIILITTHLSMVILYCAYSAKLVSNLSVKVPDIQSFEDLLVDKYQLIFDEASVSMLQYGKNLKSYYGDKLQNEARVVKSLDLMKTLMESKSALLSFHDDVYRYYGWYSEHPDRFACSSIQTLSAEDGFPTRVGMVLPKTSDFKEIFNYKIILLMERGLNDRYNRIYQKQTQPQCLQPTLGQLLESTSLKEVGSAFLIMGFGLVLSVVILVIERGIEGFSTVQ